MLDLVKAQRRELDEPASLDAPMQLSELIAAIYDASLDPTRWPAALLGCREFVGGQSACIYSKSLSGTGAQLYFDDGGIAAHYKAIYFSHYMPLDPTNAGHVFAELEQPVSTLDLLPHNEFYETRFYREWAAPQGLIDFVSAPIEKAGNWAAMVGIFRSEQDGVVDDATRDRMRLIVPHIRRAVLIGRAVEQGRAAASSLTEAFDGLAAAMFLVDATGRIVHANRAAGQMLSEARVVVSRQGRLSALDRSAAASLEDVLSSAADGDDAIGNKGISIPIDVDDARCVAHVLPLTGGARRFTSSSAVAAVFVVPATLHTPGAAEVVAKSFGLTLAELRVLITVVETGGVAETAETLGIAETTVKTHLQRVFSKTGTSRQADLVKLLVTHASPLAG